MITVSEAKKLISDHLNRLETVCLDLKAASGHVLAKDIYALYDIPAYAQSSMDGYALSYGDHDRPLKLKGEMAAGTDRPMTIQKGEASRIFTGAPLPVGADTVVMQEKTSREGNYVTSHDPFLNRGSHVRARGAEIRAGVLALKKGTPLNPAATGFLAGIGISIVEVFPMPKITLILTGNELQQPGQAPGFGQVYESNSYALTAALREEGITEILVSASADDLAVLTNILSAALNNSDVVLLTGGVSVGDYDFVIAAAGRCGVRQIFHKVKQKPGKPLFFGKKNEKLVFGLPGNPSSVLSCYYNYVLPALRDMTGRENVKEIRARLAKGYQKPAGLTHFLKGHYNDGEAVPLNAQDSFQMSSFAQANCLICLDEARTDFSAGEFVNILLLP